MTLMHQHCTHCRSIAFDGELNAVTWHLADTSYLACIYSYTQFTVVLVPARVYLTKEHIELSLGESDHVIIRLSIYTI